MLDWHLMRASGIVVLVLLSAVMVLGILTAQRDRLSDLPRFVTADLHRNLSLLSLVFLLLHIVTALTDAYAKVSLTAVLVPGTSPGHTLWISFAALSLDVMIALIATSLLRVRFGHRAWRLTHWLAYLSWPLAFAHGLGIGSDASSLWFEVIAFGCLAAVLLAAVYRFARHRPGKRLQPQVTA